VSETPTTDEETPTVSTAKLVGPDGKRTRLATNHVDALIAAVRPANDSPAYGWISRGRHNAGEANLSELGLARLQTLGLGAYQEESGPGSYVRGMWLNQAGTALAHQLADEDAR
jgi:hypothetical protein